MAVTMHAGGPHAGTPSDWDPELVTLYQAERTRLRRVALLMTGDAAEADDLVHDAFLALHRHWSRLADPAAAAGYLHVSVVNGARSAHRRRRTARRHLRVAEPEAGPSADVRLLLDEEHRAVTVAVRRLPGRQRQAVVLRYWAGLTEAQTALAMGISAGTVKSTVSRALQAVGRMLEDGHED